jgi:hypothetical protein
MAEFSSFAETAVAACDANTGDKIREVTNIKVIINFFIS